MKVVTPSFPPASCPHLHGLDVGHRQAGVPEREGAPGVWGFDALAVAPDGAAGHLHVQLEALTRLDLGAEQEVVTLVGNALGTGLGGRCYS